MAVCAVTTTLTLGLSTGLAAAAPPTTAPMTAEPVAPSAGSEQPLAVTLITGDRVIVYPGDQISVAAGPGRAGTRFHTEQIKGHHYVIPADAMPLLEADRLDRRLFDVTALLTFGYDDRTAELPLLVAYPVVGGRSSSVAPSGVASAAPAGGVPAAAARSAVAVAGTRVERDLPVVGALTVRAERDARAALWNALTVGTPTTRDTDGSSARQSLTAPPAPNAVRALNPAIGKVWLDGKRGIDLDVSVPQIGAPVAWQAGLDGTGVMVSVLDTGIDATHPDLAGRVVAAENFTSDPDADDNVGHGTHVASTIAGSGAASGGRYRGVAPGAKLLNGKVCVDDDCTESAILAGMQWSVQRGARVVNLSLGSVDTPQIDPLEQAINDLSDRYGTLFVVAAGNSGSGGSVGSPASADAALAVGAVDSRDRVASFSSKGPRIGDAAIKPEITAPGVDIVAAKATHGVIGDPAPLDAYTSLSGTSMAAPHVAGAAAILTQQHPDWTARQRKTALMASARPTDGVGVFAQGAGRVDVARAITQLITVDAGSISFGRQQWPHGDDTPSTRTVRYRNLGKAPVTLALTVQVTGPTGAPAPADFATLSDQSVTVPPSGTADVALTVDTAVTGPDGFYTGYVTGTAADSRVQTPFAVEREAESYDVTLVHTDRRGRSAKDAKTTLLNLETFSRREIDGSHGTVTVRLPRGTYGLISELTTGATTATPLDDTTTLLVQPKLVVGARSTVRLNALRGRRISVRVPRAEAVATLLGFTMQWTNDRGSTSIGVSDDTLLGQYVAQIGPKAPFEGFLASVAVSFAQPGPGPQRFRNSPYTYDLAWFSRGRMFNGLVRRPGFFDLAALHTTYASGGAGVEGVEGVLGSLTDSGGWMTQLPFDLPFRRIKYVNTDGGVGWESVFSQQLSAPEGTPPETISTVTLARTVYRPGHAYRQDWSGPMPAMSSRARGGRGAADGPLAAGRGAP